MAKRTDDDEKYKPYGGIPVFACSASDICEDCMGRFYEREAEREAEAKAREAYSKAFSRFLETSRQQKNDAPSLEKNPHVDIALEVATKAWNSMSDTEKNIWVDQADLVGDKAAQEGIAKKARRYSVLE